VRALDFVVRDDGIALTTGSRQEVRGTVLVAADGLRSTLRRRLGHQIEPHFAHHTAWRALVPAEAVPPALAGATVNLWLGRDGHLVHYPIRGERMINVVAIVRDDWQDSGWSSPGSRTELLERFPATVWHASARELLGATVYWQKWALADCAPLPHWGQGSVTLLGDAAHPMLPFLAQGAAMAIEDAAVLASCLGRTPDDVASALRAYERVRIPRTTRTQRAARRNATAYHMGGAKSFVRALALRAMGGDRLIRHYDWLYGWTPP
jgi:salicylate hydroxylase